MSTRKQANATTCRCADCGRFVSCEKQDTPCQRCGCRFVIHCPDCAWHAEGERVTLYRRGG